LQKANIPGIGQATLDASSWVQQDKEGAELYYSPKNVLDKKFGTSWQVSNNGGIGETITIRWSASHSFSISLVNGFAKTEDLYNQNNRITGIRLTCLSMNSSTENLVLADNKMDYQSAGSCTNANGISLEVTDVAKGSKWQDAAISEIKFDLMH